MKNRHPKRKIALKMRSKLEAKFNIPIFQTKNWNIRVEARKKKQCKSKKTTK